MKPLELLDLKQYLRDLSLLPMIMRVLGEALEEHGDVYQNLSFARTVADDRQEEILLQKKEILRLRKENEQLRDAVNDLGLEIIIPEKRPNFILREKENES